MDYKKIDINELQLNPFDEIGDHWMLVSSKKGDAVNTMTVSWGGLGVLWGKNVATIYIRPQRYTKEFIDNSEYFTITMFDGHKKELGVLGTKSGRDGNKIKEVEFDVVSVEGQATYKQGKMAIICKKMYHDNIKPDKFIDKSLDDKFYPQKDYHEMYIGEIVSVYKNV